MVTLRYVQEQEDAAARLHRLQAARRMAHDRGVDNARRYAAAKRTQSTRVQDDLRRQWERDVLQRAALIDRALYDGQARQGEGMQRAVERSNACRAEAVAELHAWESERALESERHRLAAARHALERGVRTFEATRIARQRQHARDAENRRRRAMLAAPPPAPPRWAPSDTASPLQTAVSLAVLDPNRRHTPHNANASPQAPHTAVLHAPYAPACVEGAEAEAFAAARRAEWAERQKTAEKAQREAAARAAEWTAKQHEQKEEAAAAIANRRAAMKGHYTPHPNPPTAKGEREEKEEKEEKGEKGEKEEKVPSAVKREATLLAAKAEEEFAAVFIRAATLPASTPSGPCAASATGGMHGEIFPLATLETLLPEKDELVVRLPQMSFQVPPVVCVDLEETPEPPNDGWDNEGGWDAHGNRKEDTVSHDAPQADHTDPNNSNNNNHNNMDHGDEMRLSPNTRDANASATCIAPPVLRATEESAPVPVRCLDRHHEKFLRGLVELQERLTRAAEVNAAMWNSNLSISTMSSVITGASPTRLPDTTHTMADGTPTRHQTATQESSSFGGSCFSTGSTSRSPTPTNTRTTTMATTNVLHSSTTHQTDTSSNVTSLSSLCSRSYPTMTADQLKAALLRMKMRMQTS